MLVSFESEGGGSPEPSDPEAFSRDLARAVDELLADPVRREAMGKAARARVMAHFSWHRIAEQTVEFYRTLLDRPFSF